MTDTQPSGWDDQVSLHVLEALGHGVVVTDAAERVIYMNPAATALTGRSLGSASGRPLSKVLACIDPTDRRPAPIAVNGGVPDRCNGDGRLLLRADGGEAIISDTVTVLRDSEGVHTGYVVVIQDARHLRELVYQATHDPLTGLVNRREFERRLWRAVEESRRDGVVHAMCFVDLDCFKSVNDHAGHAAGDAVLGCLARGMRLVLRDGDVVGRLGGDEFGILLEHCPLEVAIQLADSLRECVPRIRLRWGRQTLTVRASIGVLSIDGTVPDPGDAFRKADIACYVAKASGRDAVHVYSGETWNHVRENRRWRYPPDAEA